MYESDQTTTVAIKPCRSCGAGLIEESRFCRLCGAPQSHALPPSSPTIVSVGYSWSEPLEQYATARTLGEKGLECAGEPRQVRNAHYLLGEACYKAGDIDAAEYHFSELSRYYPQFRNLKSLLFAIDLRSMINLKL